jgi:hypothetical protein
MHFCVAKVRTSSAPCGGTFPKGEGIWSLAQRQTAIYRRDFVAFFPKTKKNALLQNCNRAFEFLS